MTGIPKSLYAIANRYWLESTSYNPHYKIYRYKKVAEKNANKLKEKYSKSIFLKRLADEVKVVEYRLVEDEDNK